MMPENSYMMWCVLFHIFFLRESVTLLIREALKHPAVQYVEDFEEKVGMFIIVTDGFWTLDYLDCSQNNISLFIEV